MPIAAADLVHRGSANIPEDDTSTSGGAIDAAARPLDVQLNADDTIDVVSDGADTRVVTITGRDATGAIATEALTLNGATPVTGAQVFERILNISIGAVDASRTVTASDGDAGQGTLHTFNPNETLAYIHFQRSSSEGTQTIRYEKGFWRNEHGTLTLTSAEVTLTADPDAIIQIALATAKDDTESVANRETAPASVGAFTDDSVAIAVPGDQLAANVAIGVWAEMTLPADDAPHRTSFTTELAGQTT